VALLLGVEFLHLLGCCVMAESVIGATFVTFVFAFHLTRETNVTVFSSNLVIGTLVPIDRSLWNRNVIKVDKVGQGVIRMETISSLFPRVHLGKLELRTVRLHQVNDTHTGHKELFFSQSVNVQAPTGQVGMLVAAIAIEWLNETSNRFLCDERPESTVRKCNAGNGQEIKIASSDSVWLLYGIVVYQIGNQTIHVDVGIIVNDKQKVGNGFLLTRVALQNLIHAIERALLCAHPAHVLFGFKQALTQRLTDVRLVFGLGAKVNDFIHLVQRQVGVARGIGIVAFVNAHKVAHGRSSTKGSQLRILVLEPLDRANRQNVNGGWWRSVGRWQLWRILYKLSIDNILLLVMIPHRNHVDYVPQAHDQGAGQQEKETRLANAGIFSHGNMDRCVLIVAATRQADATAATISVVQVAPLRR
jgi:hypothetical protein